MGRTKFLCLPKLFSTILAIMIYLNFVEFILAKKTYEYYTDIHQMNIVNDKMYIKIHMMYM